MSKRHPTEAKKRKWLPRCIHDQEGFRCYQCGKELKPGHYVFEHLNDDREDDRYENIALCCVSCNNKKHFEGDMQLKAIDLLHKKEDAGLEYLEDDDAHSQNSSEININQLLWTFTERRIAERIASDNEYDLNDALAEIPYNCHKLYGHGSEQTIRRMIKELTCKDSPWQIIKNDKGKKIICRRSLN